MTLEAVWFKDGKEIKKVSPVMCIVSYENFDSILDIEIEDGVSNWHLCEEADDFVIRIKGD